MNQTFGSSIINTLTYTRSGNEIEVTRAGDKALNAEINSLIPTVFPDSGKTNQAGDRAHPVYWGGATGRDLWNMAPWQNSLDLDVLKNDYQQVFGDHWVKAGFLYGKSAKQENCCGASGFEAPHFWGGAGVGGWGATSGNRIADILIKDMYHGFDESSHQPAPEVEWKDIDVYVGDSWSVTPTLTVDVGVRYSRVKQPEAKGKDIVAFYPEYFDPALGNDPCNGIAQVPGTDPCGEAGLLGGADGVSASFVEEDTNNFAPRLGMAWDLFGNGESVVRAGVGQYFQRERVNIQLDFGAQPPFVSNTSGIRALDYAPPGNPGYGVPTRGINSSNEVPSTWQYNVTWEQRLWGDSSIEIGYVGSRGQDLVNKVDINQVRAGDRNGNGIDDRLDFARSGGDGDGSVRPYFTGGADRILYWDNRGKSEYDGLQTQFRMNFGRGSLFQASYTWSRFKANTSVVSSSGGEENVQITDLDNPGLDWGYADLHREHVFNASLVWNLPSFEGRGGFMEHVLGNWTIASVLAYSSGIPLTVYAVDIPGVAAGGYAGTGYDDNLRALRVSGQPCNGKGQQIINPNAYTVVGARLGDTSQMSRRGDCEGPDYFQLDLSFYKSIYFGSAVDAQLRFEIFNITNQTNWIGSSVENNMRPFDVQYDADMTQIVAAETPENFGLAQAARDPRQVQLGLKLSF